MLAAALSVSMWPGAARPTPLSRSRPALATPSGSAAPRSPTSTASLPAWSPGSPSSRRPAGRSSGRIPNRASPRPDPWADRRSSGPKPRARLPAPSRARPGNHHPSRQSQRRIDGRIAISRPLLRDRLTPLPAVSAMDTFRGEEKSIEQTPEGARPAFCLVREEAAVRAGEIRRLAAQAVVDLRADSTRCSPDRRRRFQLPAGAGTLDAAARDSFCSPRTCRHCRNLWRRGSDGSNANGWSGSAQSWSASAQKARNKPSRHSAEFHFRLRRAFYGVNSKTSLVGN